MKKINTKEHQVLVEVFERYKLFYDQHGNVVISEQEDQELRQNINELLASYDYYQILLSELKICLQRYRSTSAVIKAKMSTPVRKMITISKNKK